MRPSNFAVYITSLLWLNLTDAKIGYFWHITDLHYDPFHNSPDFHRGCRHRGDHNHRNTRHRDHTCDSTYSLIQSAAAFMAERHPDTLEFVLWTGDILSSTMEHLTEDFKLEAVRNVTDILSRTFSSQFVFPALGHNDPLPSRRLVDMWMQWLPTEALQTFETGGYYTIEQSHSKLRIVVLNSVLWSGGQLRTDGPHLPHRGRAQWEFLEKVLSTARRKNEMVYLVAHAGPGVEERHNAATATAAGGGELSPNANARLLHVIRAFSDVIAGQFYGHRHTDTFRLVYSEGRPVSWAMLAPSLTPRSSGGVSNPGLRLYKFDSNTGKVLDYTQYYLDISKGDGHWAVEYNLTQYYGLREVSSTSLDALAEKMRNHHDRGIFNKYLTALRVRQATDISDCDLTCAHMHYCAVTRADYHEFRTCVRNPASALASRAPQTSAAILLYAILILLTS